MDRPQQPFQTDASRLTVLPNASLLPRANALTIAQIPDVDSDEYLANVEEEWNKKVDAEIEVLADGMADLVGISAVSHQLQ